MAGAWDRTAVCLQPPMPMPKGFYIRKSPGPVIGTLAANLPQSLLWDLVLNILCLLTGLAPAAAGRLLPPGGEARHSLAGLSLRLEREQEPLSTAPRTADYQTFAAMQPLLPMTAVTQVLT